MKREFDKDVINGQIKKGSGEEEGNRTEENKYRLKKKKEIYNRLFSELSQREVNLTSLIARSNIRYVYAASEA